MMSRSMRKKKRNPERMIMIDFDGGSLLTIRTDEGQ